MPKTCVTWADVLQIASARFAFERLCVPRIPSAALTSKVALPAIRREDQQLCACGSCSSSSRRAAAWLRLSQREEAWKTAEILILRHQLAVLQQPHRLKRHRSARIICTGHAFVQNLRRGHAWLHLNLDGSVLRDPWRTLDLSRSTRSQGSASLPGIQSQLTCLE